MTGCACGIREDWGAHLSKRFTGNVVREMMPGPLPALQIINKTKKETTKETQKRQCQTKAKKKTSLSGRWWFAYHHPDNDTDKIRLIVVGWSTRLDQELTCIMAGIFSDDFENWSLQCPCILYRRLWKINSKIIEAAIGNVLSSDYDLSKTFRPRCFWQICTVFPCVCKFSKMSASQPSAFSIGQLLLEIAV